MTHRLAVVSLALGALACAPPDPCRSADFRAAERASLPYAGHWLVARGDTLTLPQMGDRFRLAALRLDTTRISLGRECRFRGALLFTAPTHDSLPVTWIGQPGSFAQAGRALVIGWPATLGPFAGVEAHLWGDSLVGGLMFDAALGVQVQPGVTAQFVAARAP